MKQKRIRSLLKHDGQDNLHKRVANSSVFCNVAGHYTTRFIELKLGF